MTAVRPQEVRRQSIRVALAATGIVAVVYLVVSVAVVAIVDRNLTAQIDAQLTAALHRSISAPFPGGGGGGGNGGGGGGYFPPPDSDRPGGLPFLTWTVRSDGTVFAPASNPDLPTEYVAVIGPQTATIAGIDMRIAGATTGDDHVIVAQNLDSVAQAQSTLILAELLIAPLLLLVVFVGAVAIGRRVATPIAQASRRQLEFTADASHELRTPLSVIEAQTSLALAQDRTEEWYRTAFARVDLESKRMRRLLDDLLWLARFDATSSPPNVEPVDLGVLAAQTVDRFGVVAEARHLQLDVQVPSESLVINAPPEWLDRLLGVLLDNACKYSPEGTAVTVSVVPERARVSLVVDDHGPGIPAGERARIFDRFHRATEQQGGAGLGLAIADAIVRATNGRWRVETGPGGGARMAVTWDRA
ncbi:MAG TPA: HAMP domain-containing sensor histidine kinase [Candidatus Limnocylindrales bacterium]